MKQVKNYVLLKAVVSSTLLSVPMLCPDRLEVALIGLFQAGSHETVGKYKTAQRNGHKSDRTLAHQGVSLARKIENSNYELFYETRAMSGKQPLSPRLLPPCTERSYDCGSILVGKSSAGQQLDYSSVVPL